MIEAPTQRLGSKPAGNSFGLQVDDHARFVTIIGDLVRADTRPYWRPWSELPRIGSLSLRMMDD
jgi:hypothetical protein